MSDGIRDFGGEGWSRVSGFADKPVDKVPDRVNDAPIPEDLKDLYAYDGGMRSRELILRIALLEAEKQAAQDALTWIERNYVWGTRIVAQALSAKPTAAKPEPSPSSAKQGEPS